MVRVVAVHPAATANHKRQSVDDVGQGTVFEGHGGVEADNVKGSDVGLPHTWSFRDLYLRETPESTRLEVGVAVHHHYSPVVR